MAHEETEVTTTFIDRNGKELGQTGDSFVCRMMDCVQIGQVTYFISAAEIKSPFDKQTVTLDAFPVPSKPVLYL